MVSDRSVDAHALGLRLFRIIAAEAHSWAALLIEDNVGETHLYHVGTTNPTPIDRQTATSLIEARVYRPWSGATDWSALDRLPVARTHLPTGAKSTLPMPTSFHRDELQSA